MPARIRVEQLSDGIEVTIRHPQPRLRRALIASMWLPAVVGIVCVLILSRTFGFSVYTLSFLGAGLFWTLIGNSAGYPLIAAVQRVTVRNGVVRVEHPLGTFRSIGFAKPVDLSRFATLRAEVVPLARSSQDAEYRPAFTPRVRIMGDATHGAIFGPCLNAGEAAILADALNRNLASWFRERVGPTSAST